LLLQVPDRVNRGGLQANAGLILRVSAVTHRESGFSRLSAGYYSLVLYIPYFVRKREVVGSRPTEDLELEALINREVDVIGRQKWANL
jgi:hypothetical protein